MFADASDPPYVAVIFSSQRTESDEHGYGEMADRMDHLAAQQPGYMGIESARDADGFGLTVSFWASDAHARSWKQVTDHLAAQQEGRDTWYRRYIVRVASVQRQYQWTVDDV